MSRFDYKPASDTPRSIQNSFRLLVNVLFGFRRGDVGHIFDTPTRLTRSRGVTSITEDYTALVTDDVILADTTAAAVVVTLPAASALVELDIKKVDSAANNVVIDGSGSETIDGALTATLSSQYDSVRLASDGTGWHLL